MPTLDFDEIQVGEQYGPLEYVLTPEKLETFRKVVGDPDAVYPTIASKDYSNLLRSKYDEVGLINAKHESWYSSPPRPGERITTRGHLADKYVRRGRAYVVVETHSVGDDGRQLVRSKTTLLLRGVERRDEA